MGLEIIFVLVGGALGAVTRFLVSDFAARVAGTTFPWGTLVVNIVGCLAMGAVLKWTAGLESSGGDVRVSLLFWQRAVAVGFLGGMTTFSAFSADTVVALSQQKGLIALLNVAANLLLCLAAVWLGMQLIPLRK